MTIEEISDSINQVVLYDLSDPYECTAEPLPKFDMHFFCFQKNSIVDARVYDELHLVGIPSLNSCIPTVNYVFSSKLLVKKFSILGSIVTLSLMNSKTAYAMSKILIQLQNFGQIAN